MSSVDGDFTPLPAKASPANLQQQQQLEREDFSCRICLELLHKPCVNACGHAFCFWCFHRAMDFLRTKHHCPLCRAEFRHFPAVCVPLFRYIAGAYPDEVAARTEQTRTLEREEYHAESPSIDDGGGESGAEELQWRDGFKCTDCGELACPPTVLSCGHVVCCSSSRSSRKVCPVRDCVGRATAEGAPAVCYLMDKVLRKEMTTDEYADASSKSDQCGAGVTAGSKVVERIEVPSEADDGSSTDNLLPGMIVVLGGLRSEAGARLNGSEATIQSYDVSSGRYTVRLSSPPQNVRPVFNVKGENLQQRERETYVHYGVGCDGCGVYPISGRRYKCDDCSEEIGFDLCGDCYDAGVHKRTEEIGGRFNQQHRPEHKLSEVDQEETLLHQLQRSNPDMTLPQLMEMIGMEIAPSSEP